MNHFKRFTITAALPYANGPLHIGHIAGAYLPADIYARYLRLKGKKVAFICGTDEHGAAITIKAKQEGVTPSEIVDKYHVQMSDTFKKLGVSFDVFHRTSAAIHHETAQEFFLDLYNKGAFEEKETEQYYDSKFNQFLADRYIKGTCPKCGHTDAYGDQCEKCGADLSPLELINPLSTLSGDKPTLKKTKHWFLPLNKAENWLKEWINEGKLDGKFHHEVKSWKKNVMGQVNSWLNDGLHPRAITRDLEWGVDVPKEIKGAEGKKLYVWMDAPIGYISATKQLEMDGKIANWKDYWQNDETALIHFIGKDNIVFHAIIFPAILKAKENYNLPINVPANEFLNLEGDKISTSRNWAVWVHEYAEYYPDKIDELRYALCANMPETKDAEFTWDDFKDRVNNELVATFGNFVNRIYVLNQKYYEGKIANNADSFEKIREEAQSILGDLPKQIGESIEAFKYRDALDKLLTIARNANKFLTDKEPWKLVKTDENMTKAVLYACSQIVANLGILSQPFLPFTANKIFQLLKLDNKNWQDAGRLDLLKVGHQLGESQLLFQKIDDDFVTLQKEKLQSTKTNNQKQATKNHPPVKETIQFDDFAKIDLRIGTITEAQKVPKADRLLQFTVDLGFEKRIIISGVAEFFTPDECVGKQVQVLVNLAPRKMRGVESQGMILFAEDSEGKLHFVSPANKLEEGSGVA